MFYSRHPGCTRKEYCPLPEENFRCEHGLSLYMEVNGHRILFDAGQSDAFLYNDFGSGWEWWPDFDRFHQIAIDELNAFNYEEYKANGFKVKHLDDCGCELYDRPEGSSPVPLMCKR